MALTLTSALTKQTASTVGYFLMEYCSTATPVLCPIPTGVLKDLNDNHKCINTQNLYNLKHLNPTLGVTVFERSQNRSDTDLQFQDLPRPLLSELVSFSKSGNLEYYHVLDHRFVLSCCYRRREHHQEENDRS